MVSAAENCPQETEGQLGRGIRERKGDLPTLGSSARNHRSRLLRGASCVGTGITGTRALVPSDIDGVSLDEAAEMSLVNERELNGMLSQSLRAVAELCLAPDDYKLDNYHLVGGAVMLVDFDSSYFFDDEEVDDVVHGGVEFIMRLL